ncbi:MAG: hypothetical protein JXA20_06715 [Spirochaetes bacterium]|nr:hypothetical protein [Spirochaetota bacterium]
MTETAGQKPATEASGSAPGRGVVTLTVLGLLFVLASFLIIYRAERTNNRQWILKRAEAIDPANPGVDAAMVKFSGVPSGNFIEDPETGKRFVYLSRSLYRYEKGPGASVAPDWRYSEGTTLRAGDVKIGAVAIRLEEAEIIGGNSWSATRLPDARGGAPTPRIGDLQVRLSGIPAEAPLFCAGRLSGGYLGAGDLFIVSSHSEGRTMEELRETWIWRWIRHPLCFFLLLVGFLLLGHPAMRLLKRYAHLPVVRSLSGIGWPAYIVIILPASFLLVRFSPVTADLLWLVLALLLGVPAAVIVRSIAARQRG